jgi:hypothetical protein
MKMAIDERGRDQMTGGINFACRRCPYPRLDRGNLSGSNGDIDMRPSIGERGIANEKIESHVAAFDIARPDGPLVPDASMSATSANRGNGSKPSSCSAFNSLPLVHTPAPLWPACWPPRFDIEWQQNLGHWMARLSGKPPLAAMPSTQPHIADRNGSKSFCFRQSTIEGRPWMGGHEPEIDEVSLPRQPAK